MRPQFKINPVIIAGIVFAVVIISLVIVLIRIGGAYRGGLSSLSPQGTPQTLTLKKKRDVKKITIQRAGEAGCLEVTPDGVVRVYSVCGETLDDAARLTDSKNILKLFKLLSEQELSTLQQQGAQLYTLTIETDTGTQTITVALGGGTGGDEIIKTITDIQGDLPGASASPLPTASGGSLPVYGSPSAQPSGVIGGPSPTPGASDQVQQPFICDFAVGASPKPFRISNIVCTGEPVPGQ